MKLKRLLQISTLLAAAFPFGGAKADVDPNFYIYLCFGQSNMEGNASPQTIDNESVDTRFRMLATTKFSSPVRQLGYWYNAKIPIVSPAGKLGVTDYFGRTMVAALPDSVRVGVVAVAMGGSPIEMFDKDKYAQKMAQNPGEWWVTLANQYYGGNPYQRLVDMGKKAQESGVIKGMLLHQGCSNNGDPNWPNMVKKIYNDLLNDLDLQAEDVPLFVGETLRQDQGGACYAHNTQVARMPKVVPTSHVVSSAGCPGNGQDPWHFSALGYRIMGKRYAQQALLVMGREMRADANYVLPNHLRKLLKAESLNNISNVKMAKGAKRTVKVTAKFLDGHTEDVSDEVTLSGPDIMTFNGNQMTLTQEGGATITVSYTDFTGNTVQTTFQVNEELNSIDQPSVDHQPSSTFYNLKGQRVDNPTKGIYIVNGRKVIVK